MTRVVLGSASSGRLGVLRQAGIDPLVIVSDVDEDAIIAARRDAPPADVVTALATAKADAVVARVPDSIAADTVVVGCDSMLLLDGRLCGKPGSPEAAQRQWQTMAGRSGDLYTGHCVIRLRDGDVVGRTAESASTTVHFSDPTPGDLTAYVESGEPLWVAGAFTLDGLGGWFVDGIEGDPSNVIGLSLPLLRRLLNELGLSIADLWSANRG
ncbi:septum formation inhibitor Maf [Mycolicibacterium wolinskyi]|uniref:Nucleoside triphosphate pyrophosphatase n=1 Tax=Mycolicibacterium wolinskyi TaxID=59750 RepID=A0A132PV26_9MYCO|nr:Maf family protein [Mycolicibacterium wolinskyi]KWX26165.1 septum formation inhibitor Maf [Mycolicibacterium wolinskyi]